MLSDLCPSLYPLLFTFSLAVMLVYHFHPIFSRVCGHLDELQPILCFLRARRS